MKKLAENMQHRSGCAVSMALEAVGDKWSLLILRDLMFSDKRSYGALQASEEKIATNILAARLVSLEANGLIRKTMDPADTRRSLYFLTEKGIYLLPTIFELMQWMARFDPSAAPCSVNTAGYKEDRVKLYESLIAALKQSHGVTEARPS